MFKILKVKLKNRILQRKLKKTKKIFSLDIDSLSNKRVLIIDEIVPEFDKDSGSRRLSEIIKLLLKNNVSVFLIGDIKEYKYKSDYIQKFKDLGVIVYEPSVDVNGNLLTKEGFIKNIAHLLDIAWLHRPLIFDKYHQLISGENENIELVFDMVDFHYLRLMREWELDKSNVKLKKQAEKLLEIEVNNCEHADKIIVISDLDKTSLSEYYADKSKMISIGNVHDLIPKSEGFLSFQKRKDLLFIGGFKHAPNIDAVQFLKNEIMPLVWHKLPDVKVRVVGSYPTEAIKELHSDKFEIIGFVEDVSEYFKKARLFVAPLRYGAGIKGKIGQSIEYSLPLITTSIGEEGFDFGDFSKNMVANTAKEFADILVSLYENEHLWNEVSNYSNEIIYPFSKQENERKVKEILSIKTT